MLILWPLGSFIYGVFASQKKILQSLVIIFVLMTCIGLGLIFKGLDMVMQNVSASTDSSVVDLTDIDITELSLDEVSQVKSDSKILNEEVGAKEFGLNKRFRSMCVYSLLDPLLSDGKLSHQEYEEWKKIFESRHTMDYGVLLNRMKDNEIHSGDQIQI